MLEFFELDGVEYVRVSVEPMSLSVRKLTDKDRERWRSEYQEWKKPKALPVTVTASPIVDAAEFGPLPVAPTASILAKFKGKAKK